jgi:RNA polymerase sigma-70 factor (ECF subfamily)
METAFDEIYRQYSADLYRFILKMTQDENLALDIMQETMLKAAVSFDRFRGACAVKTWLCSIARNEYCTWLKKNGNPPVSIHDLPEPASPERIPEQTENHDLALQLHTLLHRLEEPYKEVFLLRVFAELRYSEIGRLFGKSESWAGVTFFRAKKKILAMMTEEGETHEK